MTLNAVSLRVSAMNTFRIGGTLLMLLGLSACANFGVNNGSARLSGDFSYYEPFDNSGETGPNFLIGPSPRSKAKVDDLPSDADRSFPSIPDRSLPPSCLSCD